MTQAALYRYYRTADSVLDSKSSLSRMIALSVLAEVNNEVKLVAAAGQKKR